MIIINAWKSKKKMRNHHIKLSTLSTQIIKEIGKIWDLVPLCVCWCVWRERNARMFDDSECSIVKLKQFCVHNLFEWANAHNLSSADSLVSFIDSLNCRI